MIIPFLYDLVHCEFDFSGISRENYSHEKRIFFRRNRDS